jgi:hypothetical protein
LVEIDNRGRAVVPRRIGRSVSVEAENVKVDRIARLIRDSRRDRDDEFPIGLRRERRPGALGRQVELAVAGE